MGPQATLYVPHGVLRVGPNNVLILEQERAGCGGRGGSGGGGGGGGGGGQSGRCRINFVDEADIDAPVPQY